MLLPSSSFLFEGRGLIGLQVRAYLTRPALGTLRRALTHVSTAIVMASLCLFGAGLD